MPDDRLDLVRRPPRSLLRYAVVSALLTLAALVLLVEVPAAPATREVCRGTPAPSSAAAPPHERPSGAGPSGAGRSSRAAPPAGGDASGVGLPVPAGMVGVPVQLAEPATAAVLRPGDRVDVIARTGRPAESPGGAGDAAGDAAGDTVVLARDVLVLSVGAAHPGSPEAGIVYLAMRTERAERVARTAPDVAVGVTVRPH